MKVTSRDGEQYDLDVQGAIAILQYAASVYCTQYCADMLYTSEEVSASLALLKKEVA